MHCWGDVSLLKPPLLTALLLSLLLLLMKVLLAGSKPRVSRSLAALVSATATLSDRPRKKACRMPGMPCL